mgnify:FL=1
MIDRFDDLSMLRQVGSLTLEAGGGRRSGGASKPPVAGALRDVKASVWLNGLCRQSRECGMFYQGCV